MISFGRVLATNTHRYQNLLPECFQITSVIHLHSKFRCWCVSITDTCHDKISQAATPLLARAFGCTLRGIPTPTPHPRPGPSWRGSWSRRTVKIRQISTTRSRRGGCRPGWSWWWGMWGGGLVDAVDGGGYYTLSKGPLLLLCYVRA